MAEWKKVGVGMGVGAVAGGVDQWVQNADEKRGLDARAAGTLAADKKLPVTKQIGTYYNYGVPILALLATGMNWLKGDWVAIAGAVGGQLAGRKLTHQFTTGAGSNVPSAAYTAWQRTRAQRSYDPEFDKSIVYKVGMM
jgi:hypothetical protein